MAPSADTGRSGMEHGSEPDLARLRQLAGTLSATEPGPASEFATEMADAIESLSARFDGLSVRVDALWQLISAIVESAGLSDPAAAAPPQEFVQALASARSTGRRGVRLSIDGQDWVAALSQNPPAPDPASWSAIRRIARQAEDQDEM
jgi:hypothetical protein